jgi:integrase
VANGVRGTAAARPTVAHKVIAADPCEGVVLPRCRKAEAAIRVPTINDVGRLLGAADECFRAYVALCPFAGLRMGEAAGVQVGDVDFLRRQLTVSRQLQRHGREVAVRAPKYGSERVVYLPDELVTMLAEHVPQHTPEGVPDRWVFTAYGKPLHDNGVTFRWRQTRKAAGCPSVRLHDLRHFYASGLIAAGCDVVTVQRALGHAPATTTVGTYAHLWPSAEDRTRSAASGLAAAALADSVRTAAAD